LFVLLPSTKAQNNVLANLLSLPAPPPPNPLIENVVRDKNFFSKSNPPRDDAPVDDLITYWEAQNQYDPKYAYSPTPSEKALEKIYAEIEKNPGELVNYLNVLKKSPDAADFVKRLYDRDLSDRKMEEGWRESVKEWLTYNSPYFSSELLESARQATDTDEYVTNQGEVLALARVDWDKARPILDQMLNNPGMPVSQTLARWAYYQHALAEGDIGDTDKYRKLLQETVEDKSGKPGNRDLAMDALVESGDFPGRDEWYFSLLEDETLFDLRVNGSAYTSLTTLLNHSPAEKYLEKMLDLIKSDNQTVRNVAARNLGTLLNEQNPDVIRALLPWLDNPKWAKEVSNERQLLVTALTSVQIPESVPGLISMLNESEKQMPPLRTENANVSTNSSVAVQTEMVDVYPFRSAAINALSMQRDVRAAPALRALLPQVDEYQRANVVNAILLSNGFSVPEQLEAIEITARNATQYQQTQYYNTNVTNVNTMRMSNSVRSPIVIEKDEPTIVVANTYSGNVDPTRTYDPNDIKFILGNQIVNNREPSRDFVMALVDRIVVLDKKEPAVANVLRGYMMTWRGAAINSLLLRDLKNGKADADSIVRLLSVRKELKEKQLSEIYETRGGASQTVFGISACLLEDAGEYNSILAGDDAESKIALLGCARLIRARLPVQTVAANLKSANKLLALAAELYLETEDSPEARQIVLAAHPNEAKILGARTSFSSGADMDVSSSFTSELFASVNDSFNGFTSYYFENFFEEIDATEKALQKEVKESGDLLGIYAYNDNFIRIYKDKAVYSWSENAARYHERELTKDEFDNFKYYLTSQRVDELPPFLSLCDECSTRELLMLGRGGGRRVFVKAERMPPFFAQLDDTFEELRKPPAKLHYWLEKAVPGLEILLADDKLQARAVWKTGDDFRVLIEDTERRTQIDKELDLLDQAEANKEDVDYEQAEQMAQKRREQRKFENFLWFKFAGGRLGDLVGEPPQNDYVPSRDSFPAQAESGRWKARAGDLEIRADEQGLYKLSRGVFTKIRSGFHDKPLVTPNGRWIIATKYDDEGTVTPLRINLQTNREFKIVLPGYPIIEAAAFIPSLNKVLLFAGDYYEEESERQGSYFLLDPETGAVQPAKGEIAPLVQQTFRPLQAATNPDEFWAAIPDEEETKTKFGIYNAKTLSFKPLLEISRIKFDSMNMWVDAGKVYFVYEGHMLSLPLPK
jgi:hypothetical protein